MLASVTSTLGVSLVGEDGELAEPSPGLAPYLNRQQLSLGFGSSQGSVDVAKDVLNTEGLCLLQAAQVVKTVEQYV